MKKIRTIVNIALGSMIAALGLTGCEKDYPVVKYGPMVGDTTVQCMYGVPAPDINVWDTDESSDNDTNN